MTEYSKYTVLYYAQDSPTRFVNPCFTILIQKLKIINSLSDGLQFLKNMLDFKALNASLLTRLFAFFLLIWLRVFFVESAYSCFNEYWSPFKILTITMSLTQRIVEISFYHPLYRQSTVTFYFSALCRAKYFPGFPANFSGFFGRLFMFAGSVLPCK